MPARKPDSLKTRHDTKADLAASQAAEAAMTPTTQLTVQPPALLRGNKHAAATWKKMIALYNETEGVIVTAFDEDLLIKYCKLEAECLTIEELWQELFEEKEYLNKEIAKLKKKKRTEDEVKEFFSLLEQRIAVIARFQGMDARLDGKRKLLHALYQSLYLTPRSRAGAAPKEKEKQAPKTGMAALLDD